MLPKELRLRPDFHKRAAHASLNLSLLLSLPIGNTPDYNIETTATANHHNLDICDVLWQLHIQGNTCPETTSCVVDNDLTHCQFAQFAPLTSTPPTGGADSQSTHIDVGTPEQYTEYLHPTHAAFWPCQLPT